MDIGDWPMFDVAVIGGGVIGCAVLHALTQNGYHCILLEKESSLVSQASAGNSGIAHSGFDASPGTIESDCLAESRLLLEHFAMDYKVPVRRIGAIVVAWTEQEKLKLSAIQQNAIMNGVLDTRLLSKNELMLMEPNLNPLAIAGLLVPGEAVIDSWLLPILLAHRAVKDGAKIELNCEVRSCYWLSNKTWLLSTTAGSINARAVINAAGLHGDMVENYCQPSSFSIVPRKGEFVVYSHDAGQLIKHIILPVPTEKTKGIIVYPSVYGHLVVGPSAEDCAIRDVQSVVPDKLVTSRLIATGERVVPALTNHFVITAYNGLRPATIESKDYHLYSNPKKSWITVGGIRSTGLSTCLAVALRVFRMLRDDLLLTPSKRSSPQGHSVVAEKGLNVLVAKGRKDVVVIDSVRYPITHPLSALGIRRSKL